MTDKRLRELERRWRETNAPEDEALYALELMRTGNNPEALRHAHNVLTTDSNQEEARSLIPRINSLAWTGLATVTDNRMNTNDGSSSSTLLKIQEGIAEPYTINIKRKGERKALFVHKGTLHYLDEERYLTIGNTIKRKQLPKRTPFVLPNGTLGSYERHEGNRSRIYTAKERELCIVNGVPVRSLHDRIISYANPLEYGVIDLLTMYCMRRRQNIEVYEEAEFAFICDQHEYQYADNQFIDMIGLDVPRTTINNHLIPSISRTGRQDNTSARELDLASAHKPIGTNIYTTLIELPINILNQLRMLPN